MIRLSRILPVCLWCGMAVVCGDSTVLVRPGCQLEVRDAETGLAIPDVHVTVVALHANTDTAGKWQYRTDELGIVLISAARARKADEVKAGRRSGGYDFRAVFEAGGYQYYSQRLTAGDHVVRLSRFYRIA